MRGRLREGWRTLLRDVDVVLCPAMPAPAFPHDHMAEPGRRRIEVDGRQLPYPDQIVWASIATLFGLPATVAPIGVQIIGPFVEDRTTLAFAALIERECGGFVPPP